MSSSSCSLERFSSTFLTSGDLDLLLLTSLWRDLDPFPLGLHSGRESPSFPLSERNLAAGGAGGGGGGGTFLTGGGDLGDGRVGGVSGACLSAQSDLFLSSGLALGPLALLVDILFAHESRAFRSNSPESGSEGIVAEIGAMS